MFSYSNCTCGDFNISSSWRSLTKGWSRSQFSQSWPSSSFDVPPYGKLGWSQSFGLARSPCLERYLHFNFSVHELHPVQHLLWNVGPACTADAPACPSSGSPSVTRCHRSSKGRNFSYNHRMKNIQLITWEESMIFLNLVLKVFVRLLPMASPSD